MPIQVIPNQTTKYPTTRFMGSKRKLLQEIFNVVAPLDFDVAIDAFSGSGVVSYLFKSMGKTVISNDHMHMSWQFATALIENNETTLSEIQVEKLLQYAFDNDKFVQTRFKGLYYSQNDCKTIDSVRRNVKRMRSPHLRALATSALIRACMKRRPRGVFTYTGEKYDDGRRDLQKSIAEHFIDAVSKVNAAVFDNGRHNYARNIDALALRPRKNALIYLDPPYYTPKSDSEYVRRYHFVEGLARDWKGVEIQEHTQTKKFKSYDTPFSSRNGALDAFETMFKRFRDSIIVVSYSSNALPTLDEIVETMAKYKDSVEVVPIEHRYSFGNQGHKVGDNRNRVDEFLFVGK
ncbi:MAG: DNA adenine methylase [Ilumatobacteraceae bacterium]